MDTRRPSDQAKPPRIQHKNPIAKSPLPVRPRRIFKHRSTSDLNEHKSPETGEYEEDDSMTDPDELELDPLVSDADFDEETGLTAKERKKQAARKRRQDGVDVRIAGGIDFARIESREADKHVLKKLLINAALIGLWYIFSLSISIYNKWMFTPGQLNFPFPLFTTSLHMLVQFGLASTVIFLIPSLRPIPPQTAASIQNDGLQPPQTKPTITPLFYITRLVPTGTATSLDIGLGNMSLRFITLTFYTMCKSSVLIFVLTFAFLFRLEAPSVKLILIIICMTGGVLMMVAGETAFDALGCFLALTASFFSGLRWALTQILLLRHSATHNPFATMFLLTPIMFSSLFILALFTEGIFNLFDGVSTLVKSHGVGESIAILLVPGFLAFCMIAAEFTLLQRTNVVTLSICGIFKEVVTIGAAGIVFDDKLDAINIGGLLVTIVCIACYNYIKVTKMRRDVREKLALEQQQDSLGRTSNNQVRQFDASAGEDAVGYHQDSHFAAVMEESDDDEDENENDVHNKQQSSSRRNTNTNMTTNNSTTRKGSIRPVVSDQQQQQQQQQQHTPGNLLEGTQRSSRTGSSSRGSSNSPRL